MAESGSTLPLITRTQIGKLLKENYDRSKDYEPIDCFYVQAYYSFRKWIDKVQTQKNVEQEMEQVIEKTLNERMASEPTEKWFKLTDWWPLTYFLDGTEPPKNENGESKFRSKSDRDLEKQLDKEVREKLRENLKAGDRSFSDIPIIITRACKYTPD